MGFSMLGLVLPSSCIMLQRPETRGLQELMRWLDEDRKCRICGKLFLPVTSWKQRFDRHLNTHSGARPYACPLCTHTCSRKDALKIHMLRRHSVSSSPGSGVTAAPHEPITLGSGGAGMSLDSFTRPDSEKFRQLAAPTDRSNSPPSSFQRNPDHVLGPTSSEFLLDRFNASFDNERE